MRCHKGLCIQDEYILRALQRFGPLRGSWILAAASDPRRPDGPEFRERLSRLHALGKVHIEREGATQWERDIFCLPNHQHRLSQFRAEEAARAETHATLLQQRSETKQCSRLNKALKLFSDGAWHQSGELLPPALESPRRYAEQIAIGATLRRLRGEGKIILLDGQPRSLAGGRWWRLKEADDGSPPPQLVAKEKSPTIPKAKDPRDHPWRSPLFRKPQSGRMDLPIEKAQAEAWAATDGLASAAEPL